MRKAWISDLSYLPPLGKSNHLFLQFSFNLISNDNFDYAKLNLNAGDYDHVRSQEQCINWRIMLNMTMDEA